MNSASPTTTDWGAIALLVIIAIGVLVGLVLFFRQNRKDLESLEETLKADNEDDAK